MAAEDYYPAGAYRDPDAPFNEIETPERVFVVDVNVTLSKLVDVMTCNYDLEHDEFEGDIVNTQCTNWYEEYKESHKTLPEMLDVLASYVKEDLARTPKKTRRWYELERLLSDCTGWLVVDSSYEEA